VQTLLRLWTNPFVKLGYVAAIILYSGAAYAQSRGFTPIVPTNPSGFDDLGQFINRLIEFGIAFIAVVAVLYIILNGFNYILAGGDQKKAAAARSGIQNAIIGVIIAVIAYLVVKLVLVNLLNVNTSLLGDWEQRKQDIGI